MPCNREAWNSWDLLPAALGEMKPCRPDAAHQPRGATVVLPHVCFAPGECAGSEGVFLCLPLRSALLTCLLLYSTLSSFFLPSFSLSFFCPCFICLPAPKVFEGACAGYGSILWPSQGQLCEILPAVETQLSNRHLTAVFLSFPPLPSVTGESEAPRCLR